MRNILHKFFSMQIFLVFVFLFLPARKVPIFFTGDRKYLYMVRAYGPELLLIMIIIRVRWMK